VTPITVAVPVFSVRASTELDVIVVMVVVVIFPTKALHLADIDVEDEHVCFWG